MPNMGFSKYCLLVAATFLLVALENQTDASLITNNTRLSNILPDLKVKLDITGGVFGDGKFVSAMAAKAIDEVHVFAAEHTIPGPIGEAIEVLKDGWEKTIKLCAVALNAAFDLFDNIVSKDIEDVEAALNAMNNGINKVRTSILKAGVPVHAGLGAAKSILDITDKGQFKYAIDKIQEAGTGLFDDIQTAQFFASQALNFGSNDEVKRKHLEAAHAAIKSAAEMSNINLVTGAKSSIEYLSGTDEAKIAQHEPTEKLISDASKAAAAADSDTVAALSALNKEFKIATKIGISTPILNEIKNGLVEYIEHLAWGVAICNDAIAQAKELAKTDSQSAILLINKAFQIATSILIDGSVKAYEGIGVAGRVSRLLDLFHDAIEIAEMSRCQGTKGLDSVKTVVVRAILAGGKAAKHAFGVSHKMLEAIEAAVFANINTIINKIIQLLTLKL